MINVIFATDKNLNFCSSDHVSLPWNRHQEDMAFFKKITTYSENGNNAVIMGKKTFDSLCHIPLTNRVNIIVSKTVSQQPIPEGILATTTLRDAINLAHKSYCDNIFIIGGISLITEAFTLPELERIYITTIDVESKIDSIKFNYVIPSPFVKEFTLPISTDAKVNIYVRNKYNSEGEEQYIKLVKDVLSNGESRDDRTGVGTIGVFGRQFTLDISNSFPLLTSKRVFWKGVAEELLFFISGSTDTKILEAKGVNIWKGNTTREFLDKRGLHNLQEGEYGKSYGYQWRYFGDKVDQLQLLIDGIIKDPYSRRHFMTAWNPLELDNIPLPACHLSCQFYVSKGNTLSCQVYMRSCDIFLGLPFNIASYALLTYMICHLTNLEPSKLSFCLGDAHIYKNHVIQCKEMITRPLRSFPQLFINRKVDNIDDFKYEDFTVIDYNPHPTIKAEMAV
jgi:dihydrofolate reductase/thymidylate synthase